MNGVGGNFLVMKIGRRDNREVSTKHFMKIQYKCQNFRTECAQ